MRVRIWDWHGSAKERLGELNLESSQVYEMTPEQIFALSDRFTVMLRRPGMDKMGRIVNPPNPKDPDDFDMLVAVTTYPNFNQR